MPTRNKLGPRLNASPRSPPRHRLHSVTPCILHFTSPPGKPKDPSTAIARWVAYRLLSIPCLLPNPPRDDAVATVCGAEPSNCPDGTFTRLHPLHGRTYS